jgi:hypothetical protein
MPKITGRLDPSDDRILDVGYRLLWGLTVAHAPGQVRYSRNEAAAIFNGKGLDHDWVFETAHWSCFTASMSRLVSRMRCSA